MTTPTCRNGHPWTDATIYHHPRGHAVCRVCVRASQRRHRDRVRGYALAPRVYGPVADRIVAVLARHPAGLDVRHAWAKMGYRSSVGSIRRTVYDLRHKRGVLIESLRTGNRWRYVLRAAAVA